MKIPAVLIPKNKKDLLFICLFFLALAGVFIFIASNQSKDESGGSIIVHSTSEPSEERPSNNYNWKGEKKDPKKIKIPSIGVDAFIQKVGVDQYKEVAVPNNLFLVGWFVNTVRPGEKGLSLIDGHVTGRRNDGIFKDLKNLKEGDQYTVELGDGTTISYEVTATQSLKTKDATSVIFSQDPKIPSQLNLVTCSGRFDDKSRRYEERLVVSSKQI